MSVAETIRIEAGLLSRLPEVLAPATRSVLLTDANVAPLLGALPTELPTVVVPPGEGSKSWEQLKSLLLRLDSEGLDRDGQLVAVGGGVVTDLGGMAASLHRRGIAWSAVPTSLLGQVDAAVGGKTAVNLGGGKNTVGTIHLPRQVLVDPEALATLPERELRAGLGEVLKTSLIAGTPLYEQALGVDPTDFRRATEGAVAVLRGCLDTKTRLVDEDLQDNGPRRMLNLGHTFGHAFEALAMPHLLHGEAVGLGLLCAARLGAGGALGRLEESLRARLASWGMPTTTPAVASEVLGEMLRDKKRRALGHTAIVVTSPGAVTIQEGVEVAALQGALGAVLVA